MPACGSKFVSGSSRKATVAESVFVMQQCHFTLGGRLLRDSPSEGTLSRRSRGTP